MNILRSLELIRNIRQGRILFFWIIPTLQCPGQCQMCNAWQNTNTQELDSDTIKDNLLSAPSLQNAEFILEGGEIFKHSSWQEIMELMVGRRWTLFTRGFYPKETINACRRFKPASLRLSIDKQPQSESENMLLKNIESIIKGTAESNTQISINYTVSQNNNAEDLAWVKSFARRNKVEFDMNSYSKLSYLGCTQDETALQETGISDEWGFTNAHNKWLDGKIKFPCTGLNYIGTVYPDGRIGLCKKKSDIVLGNINDRKFEQIWQSENTRRTIKEHADCNECWTKCQRMFDFRLYSKLRRVLPHPLCTRAMRFIFQR